MNADFTPALTFSDFYAIIDKIEFLEAILQKDLDARGIPCIGTAVYSVSVHSRYSPVMYDCSRRCSHYSSSVMARREKICKRVDS